MRQDSIAVPPISIRWSVVTDSALACTPGPNPPRPFLSIDNAPDDAVAAPEEDPASCDGSAVVGLPAATEAGYHYVGCTAEVHAVAQTCRIPVLVRPISRQHITGETLHG